MVLCLFGDRIDLVKDVALNDFSFDHKSMTDRIIDNYKQRIIITDCKDITTAKAAGYTAVMMTTNVTLDYGQDISIDISNPDQALIKDISLWLLFVIGRTYGKEQGQA